MVDVDVGRGEYFLMIVVLDVQESFGEWSGVVIIDHRESPKTVGFRVCFILCYYVISD